ncbi:MULTISPECIES: hypothetical protein [unclassified Sphingomonas]|uniref:hypothetical protein n=1 Tax=unclassified Sphingomonas TaxID=196159 RepID=UPI00160E469A|nr:MULTISPECIES: hypothetical protein [unclassified Sphingomonas]MBB3346289.1 hypothetical protein [Sphingomonas sp. BK069]MBB3473400.1 hypothetical protein [Sphingomonas sp. BK345]
MPGRNLPPRYRVITRDSETPASRAEPRDRRWDDDPFGAEPSTPARARGEDAASWPLIGLFLSATAAGGAGVALLGLIPDVLS